MQKKHVDYTKHAISKPKKTKSIHKRMQYVAVLSIIICFCASLLLLDYFSDGYVLADFDEVGALQKTSYYAIQMGMYGDLETANHYSALVKQRGGGGFVLKDGSYRVLASVYKNSTEAESVIKRLNDLGTNCSLYIIQTEEIFDKSLSNTEREQIKTISLCADYVYQELYGISNEIDVGTITYSETKGRLDGIVENITQYKELVSSTHSAKKAEILSNLDFICDTVKNLPLSPTSSDVRHAYIAILASRMI